MEYIEIRSICKYYWSVFASAIRSVILFQVLVPIALYVALDIVCVLQMYVIAEDKNLLDQIDPVVPDKASTIT